MKDWHWLLIALAVLLATVLLLAQPSEAQGSCYVHGWAESDGMLAGVTVSIEHQVDGQWQYLRPSTTNPSGYWGIGVPAGATRLRLRATHLDCDVIGARFPGGYHAKYVPRVGIELPMPEGDRAGNFVFLFRCQEEPPPIPTVTPTQGPRPTMTPFPDLEEWENPPQSLENCVVEHSLELVAGWVITRDELYQYAYNVGLGPFPIYGPVRFAFTDVSGETWQIEFILFPRGWVVWHDIRWPNKIRATKVGEPFWW